MLPVTTSVIVIYWTVHLNHTLQPFPTNSWTFCPLVSHTVSTNSYSPKSLKQPSKKYDLNCSIVQILSLTIMTCLFNIIGYFEGENRKSNNRRRKITKNNNSIMSLVLYLSFPFSPSNLISQRTMARTKQVFPWYHSRDDSSAGGTMKRINKEKIEFLQAVAGGASQWISRINSLQR